ncbi:MAG: MerR family transcriptional regulator, partial [Flavobacteriales bacterium]|nr:MerR family transcriptional regulator [Flavobacteriales bacterium]
TIKDVGVTHRWITHWDKEGLLFNNYEPEKWRKFDLIEYVWLKMVVQMREFNMPLLTIKNVRNILKSKAEWDEVPMEIGKQLTNSRIQDEYPGLDMELELEETLKSNELNETLADQGPSSLELIIVDAILLKNHFALLINPEGNCIPYKEAFLDEYRKTEDFSTFVHRSHVSISISQILADFISSKHLNLIHGELSMISDSEMEVIKALREEEVKSIKVKLSNKSEIELLEVVKEGKVDKAARLIDLIMNNGYQDIKLKTQQGRIVFCENTYKKKL